MECPACSMNFKIKVDPSEYSDPLAFRLSRILEDEESNPNSETETDMTCPYCGNVAAPQNFLDEDMERTIRSIAKTQIIDPAIDALMSSFTDGFKKLNSKHLKISVTEHPAPRSMLASAGPEVSDMRRTVLLCCGREAKIIDRWAGQILCPHCSTSLIVT